MDELLKPAGIVRKIKTDTEPDLLRERSTEAKPKPTHKPPSSLDDALEILRHEPDYDSLISVLAFLSRHETHGSGYSAVKLPSPTSAQLVQVLVSDIVPNYWALLSEDGHEGKNSGLKLLLYCLSSVAGVNAILVRLRALTQDAKAAVKARRPDVSLNLGILLDLLCRVLQGDGWLLEAWLAATSLTDTPARVKPRVHELVAVFGSGRIISLAAEVEDAVRASKSGKHAESIWAADAVQYTQWLARNIIKLVLSGQSPDATKFASDLLNKALRLGSPDRVIQQLLSELVLKKGADPSKLGVLLGNLPQTEQRRVLFSVLKLLSDEYLDRLGHCDTEESKPLVSAVAGALTKLLVADGNGEDHLVEWLTVSSGAGLGAGVGIRRAAMAVLSQSKDHMVTVLEKSLGQFGDQLYIKHSPMLQQEVHAQVLLLSAGYVHRKSPIKLAMLLRSSTWLNAISNRLSAPHQRARVLGMVVGEALSSLVDKGDKRLNFKMEETEQEEGRWYKGLTEVDDEIGSLNLLAAPARHDKPQTKRHIAQKPVKRPPQPSQAGFIIEELSDEELAEGDDDIVPYAKPDSDAEDSDDDATLVRRDKPKAPVYIRDLIRYLRDTESYDHQKLALATAPTLIRRKADYGTEVSEHAEELASLLVGLSDKFEIDNFDDLRTQGMIAIIVAKPDRMGPWFAKTFFDGDYSISQRASILVVLSLGARELAGVESSEYAAAAAFPSKTLPERVEKLYLNQNAPHASSSALKPLPHNALDTIATSLTSAFLAPLAATAADAATGPDVLKLSTFSSRLAGAADDTSPNPDTTANPKIKYKSSRPRRPRVRAIPNTTAHLLATSFFAPLAARFPLALHHHPSLLALYLQTLALLLHAAGPSTLALPQMTSELWRLLLAPRVRALAVGDLTVTRAMLVGFVALLDVNEQRMREVCVELGREVVEAQEWAARVFGGLKGGDEGGEEEGVRMLAAGVLVRLREGIERWRLVLVGDLIGFG